MKVVGERGINAQTAIGSVEPTTKRVPAGPLLGDGRNLADAIVFLSLAGVLGYSWFMGRGLTFFADDWNLAVAPADHLLLPHFGHLSLVPRALYRLLVEIFGLHSYAPYRLMGCLAFGAFGVSLYLYLRARSSTWFACFVAVSLIWFSQSDLFPPMFAVLVNYTIPLTAMIGIWALLDRRSTRADWLACALLAVALASSALGVIAVIAVATEFLVARAPLRRWLRFAPPVLLWLLWYLYYHEPLGDAGSARDVLVFTFREFEHTFAAFAGGSQVGGLLLATLFAIGFAFAAIRARQHSNRLKAGLGHLSGQPVPARMDSLPARKLLPDVHLSAFNARAAGALVAAIAFAGATALTRRTIFGVTQNLNLGRYLWVIGFFLVIALTACLRSLRFGPLLALLAGFMVIVNGALLVGNLEAQRSDRLHYQNEIQPMLAARQALGHRGTSSPTCAPRLGCYPVQLVPVSIVPISATEYLKAVADLGAPPGTTGEPVGSEKGKLKADRLMIKTLDIRARPASFVPAQCLALSVPNREIVVSPGDVLFLQPTQEPMSLKLKRFAATYDNRALALLSPQSLYSVSLPRDHSSVPWKLQLPTHTVAAYECRRFGELHSDN
jgi:hypothetical protein